MRKGVKFLMEVFTTISLNSIIVTFVLAVLAGIIANKLVK